MLNPVNLVDRIYKIIQDYQDMLVCEHNVITNAVLA